MKRILSERDVHIDELVRIVLTRAYSAKVAERILKAKQETTRRGNILTVHPSGRLTRHKFWPPYTRFPGGTLLLDHRAYRLVAHGKYFLWSGMPTLGPTGPTPLDNWKISLLILFLAPDLKKPRVCQYFHLRLAKEFWDLKKTEKPAILSVTKNHSP